MVTNLCPYNGNERWCPSVGQSNEYGFKYHFDIMAESAVFGDNAVVEFEPVACPGQAATNWEQCVCNGQTKSDTTPVGMSIADPAPATNPDPATNPVVDPAPAPAPPSSPPPPSTTFVAVPKPSAQLYIGCQAVSPQ